MVKFTQRQLDAIDISKLGMDTCVVAGPGSGKTTVLVEHYRRLVESGVNPLRILAITFTEKAAANMREKVTRAFASDAVVRGRLERAYISTVHGFCARLLRENAVFAGVDPEFRVLDERESMRLQTAAADEVLDSIFSERPEEARGLMRGLACANLGAAIRDVYDSMRTAGRTEIEPQPIPDPAPVLRARIAELRSESRTGWSADQVNYLEELFETAEEMLADPTAGLDDFKCNLRQLKRGPLADAMKELREDRMPEYTRALLANYYRRERDLLLDILKRFDLRYRALKQQAGGLDYSDLEEYAVRLLEEHADVRTRVQAQFDQVLMDEFQDTNGQQAKFLALLRPPDRFYAVGDINQSIYGFRNAEPAVFREYRRAVAAGGKHVVELVENFRSRQEILDFVERVLDAAPGIEPRALIAAREFPPAAEPPIEVISAVAEDTGEALRIEAESVARRILELEAAGTALRDIAVLARNSEVFPEFTAAFDACGISYLVNRGKGFYEAPEIRDLLHLLRVLVNARDEISMAAVLRSPFVAVSDEALLRLKSLGNLGAAIWKIADGFDPEDRARIEAFRERLSRWRADRHALTFDRLLLRAMDQSGYECESGTRGAANVEKFLAQARDASRRQSLSEFVEDLELIRESNPREPDAPPEDSTDAVRIMTVHSAKGLEFPVVFLAAMHKGMNQSAGSLAFSPKFGLGARWQNPATGKDADDCFLRAIRDERNEKEAAESDRLLYVAMTRAAERLILSYSSGENGKGRNWDKAIEATLASNSEGMLVKRVDAAPERLHRSSPAENGHEIREIPRPATPGQYDSNANVTSIAMFAQCPRQYYLSRYLGLEVDRPASGNSGPELGQQVHALLAGTPVENARDDAVALAQVFQRSALAARAAGAPRIEREFDFLFSVEEMVLRGQIDLWFEAAGELILVDYKTDRKPEPEHHALQLRLYALALERLIGRLPDHAYLHFLRPDAQVEIALDRPLLEEAIAAVGRFRRAQESLEFPLQEGDHCRRCPHWGNLCPATPETGN